MEDGLWNTEAFRGILPLLEDCPLLWKRFSSKQTLVTLPILLPIKIYWEHPGKHCTANIITASLSKTNKCSDHKTPPTTTITTTKKNRNPAFWVHNQHLIRRNDLQYDKQAKFTVTDWMGPNINIITAHMITSTSLLWRKSLPMQHKADAGCTARSDLLLNISWCQTWQQRSHKISLSVLEEGLDSIYIYIYGRGKKLWHLILGPTYLWKSETTT